MLHKEEHYRYYFGMNADYYMGVLYKMDAGKKYVFNFFAFIFGLMWLLYRKVFLVFLVLWMVHLCQNYLEMYLYDLTSASDETKQGVLLIGTLIWSIFIGFFGNKWYINQADKEIAKIVDLQLSEEETLEQLRLKGNITFIPHLLIILALSIVLALGKGNVFEMI